MEVVISGTINYTNVRYADDTLATAHTNDNLQLCAKESNYKSVCKESMGSNTAKTK